MIKYTADIRSCVRNPMCQPSSPVILLPDTGMKNEYMQSKQPSSPVILLPDTGERIYDTTVSMVNKSIRTSARFHAVCSHPCSIICITKDTATADINMIVP